MKFSGMGAVAGLALSATFAGGASAAVITVDLGLSGPVSNETVGVDAFGLSLQNGLSGPDGQTDFILSDVDKNDEQRGTIGALRLIPEFELGSVKTTTLETSFAVDSAELGEVFNPGAFLKLFEDGDDISAHTNWTPFGTFYDGDTGPLATVNDMGTFGFKVDLVEWTGGIIVAPEDCIDVRDPPPGCFGGGLPTREVIGSYYGYLDVTRGSIGVNLFALNTTQGGSILAGSASNTPAVPLPAAGWMLLAGLGGLFAARRRA